MKKLYRAFLIGILATMSLSSCKHALLEPWPPDAARTEEDIWTYYHYCKGAVDVLYADFIMCPYPNDIYDGSGDSWGMLACGTDEAEHSLATAAVQKFTNGAWSPSNSPLVKFGGPWFRRSDRIPWVNSYLGIRLANIALEHYNGYDKLALKDDLDDPTRRYDLTWFKGQAYFWRAYLEFDLLRRYGPFIISTQVEELDETVYRGRNTLDECVAQIVHDCDAAIDSLPVLWDEDNWFRVNKTAAQALKSRLLLYYASPLYQGDFETFGLNKGEVGDVKRWKDAVVAARNAINDNDFYQLTPVTNFKRPYSNEGTYNFVVHMAANLENNEIIFSTSKTTTLSYNYERFNLPAGIDGCEGYTNPTQELVDKFEVLEGKGSSLKAVPFDWNNPEHTKDPYANRDPRFYNDILYNGTLWGTSSSKAYYIDMWEPVTIDGVSYPGGKHRDKTLKQSTKTGYYYRKFLTEDFYAYATNQYNSLSRTRHEIRFAELLLNYAEAMNEAYGPEVPDPDGSLRECPTAGIETARDAINAIRTRVNMPPVAIGLTQAEMREVIHHERDIELCFEGHRFYDVRRWKEGKEKFGTPIHGVVITPTSFDAKTGRPKTYEYKVEQVEERIWKDCYYWWPIPMQEIVKYPNDGLKQNPGW